jgi:transcriptional regulator with XRE-family HTH domain
MSRTHATIGLLIANKRRSFGLTQEALAAIVQVHHTLISRIEAGQRGIPIDTAKLIGRALAIDPLELVPEVIGERIPIEPLEPIPIRPPAPPSPAPRVRPVVQFAFDGSIMGQLCQPIYCTCGRLVRK